MNKLEYIDYDSTFDEVETYDADDEQFHKFVTARERDDKLLNKHCADYPEKIETMFGTTENFGDYVYFDDDVKKNMYEQYRMLCKYDDSPQINADKQMLLNLIHRSGERQCHGSKIADQIKTRALRFQYANLLKNNGIEDNRPNLLKNTRIEDVQTNIKKRIKEIENKIQEIKYKQRPANI